ncbi:type II toxin-antitoxin system HipA family toxin [Thalassomonas haliotis]|nr:type II toxin-antitoxin system HipA family toxin [Thalassomonas haliotis]
METIEVRYKGEKAAAISFEAGAAAGQFEYFPEFIKKKIPLAPLTMPVASSRIYQFPGLDKDTFKGLPGLVADSLPDSFGNAILDQWLAKQVNRTHGITPLERLKYTGSRGMGALEYFPSRRVKGFNASHDIELETLTKVAQSVLDERSGFEKDVSFDEVHEDKEMVEALLAVGTSAGGARPKAVLAFNENFTQVRSGQTEAPKGFSHYLLKFDGVTERDRSQQSFGDPQGYGVMEYVYHLMALEAGIHMEPCKLLPEGQRRHFVTKRFDRVNGNEKRHIQTLTAISHVNYNQPGAFSYEQVFKVARELGLPKEDAIQIFKRMVFNHVARNNDDHSKNTAFMLVDDKHWRVTPAYDVAFSYAAGNPWVEQHWMAMNGKRKEHSRKDIYAVADLCLPKIKRAEIDEIIDSVIDAVSLWDKLSQDYEVPAPLRKSISKLLLTEDFK